MVIDGLREWLSWFPLELQFLVVIAIILSIVQIAVALSYWVPGLIKDFRGRGSGAKNT
jgi:hypothetical protein